MTNVLSKIKKAAIPTVIAAATSLGVSAPAMAEWSPEESLLN